MSDIDAEILSLESTSGGGSKKLMLQGGASLVGGAGLTYLIKPMWAFSSEVDKRTGEIQHRIRWLRFFFISMLFAIGVFFGIRRVW